MPSRRRVLSVLGSAGTLGLFGGSRRSRADAASPVTERDSHHADPRSVAGRQADRWTDQFGGSGNDEATDSVPAHGGGVVVLAGGETARLVSYAVDGRRQWDRRVLDAGRLRPAGLVRTDDGYRVAVSVADDAPWLLAVDRDGDPRWRRSYDRDWARDSLETVCGRPDGGVVLGGHETAGSDEATWLLGVGPDGEREWRERYPDVAWLSDVTPTGRGGYTAVGHVHAPTADGASITDAVVVGTDDRGRERWRRTFGGDGQDRLMAVLPRPYGALVGGVSWSGADTARGLLVAADRRGRPIWSRTAATAVTALVDRPPGTLVVTDDRVSATDRYGRTRWRRTGAGNTVTTVTVVDGTLVTAGRTTYLGEDTGSEVWVAGDPLPRE